MSHRDRWELLATSAVILAGLQMVPFQSFKRESAIKEAVKRAKLLIAAVNEEVLNSD